MKPTPNTYNPYFQSYIDLVETDDLFEELLKTGKEFIELLKTIPEERADYRYLEGKWSIKELVLHCIDCERIFQYRSLCFARKDQTELPGFKEDDYVQYSNAHQRSLKDIIDEFQTVRAATVSLFKSFEESTLDQVGLANGGKISVRACGFIIIGHEIHHRRVLIERYL